MKRRDFLKTGAAGAAAAMAARVGVALGSGASDPDGAPAAARSANPAFEVEEATIADLQEAMESGAVTARGLTEAYLARIDAADRSGPSLNSVIEINPEALAIAEDLDRERRTGGVRGPLHGIPVLIKDNIDTADRMKTTAGSLALEGSVPARDAFVAGRLRGAGAVILGKTNLSEWANFRSTRGTSGWSGRGGQTRNPYALDRNPCGSSSGSGVSVAASLCAAAVGTETDGSIVCPANASGIVGIKPTLGLVSRSGIIPIAASQDTAGPMARTVTDAAILLGVLAGADPRDPATAALAGGAAPDYRASLDVKGLERARIGVVRQLFGKNERVEKLVNEAIEAMKRLGAEVIDPVEIGTLGKFDEAEFTVLQYEFKHGIRAYLEALGPGATVRTLADLIAFNEKNRDREMPYFGQEIFVQSEGLGPLTDARYRKALAACRKLSRTLGIDKTMSEHRLDALVAPTGDPAFMTDLVNGDHYTGGGASSPPAVAGYPHVTVPAGLIFGLPVGVSFFGRAWSEPVLLRLAYAYEQATRHRRAPLYRPSANLTA